MENKDLFELIGFSPADPEKVTIDEVKEHFTTNYVGLNVAHEHPEVVKKATGKALGSVTTAVKREFKNLGVEFDNEEIKDKKLEEITALGAAKVQERIKELQEHGNKTDDKKAEALQKKLDAMQNDYQTVLSDRDNLKNSLTEKDQEFDNFKKSYQINSIEEQAWNSVEFTDSLPGKLKDITLHGFKEKFNSKYDRQLSDTQDSPDGLRIVDKKTGQRVAEGNKFLPLKDLIAREAKEADLLKVQTGGNNGSPKPSPFQPQQHNNGNGNGNGQQNNLKVPAHLQKKMDEIIADKG